jgi:hypothetical protein
LSRGSHRGPQSITIAAYLLPDDGRIISFRRTIQTKKQEITKKTMARMKMTERPHTVNKCQNYLSLAQQNMSPEVIRGSIQGVRVTEPNLVVSVEDRCALKDDAEEDGVHVYGVTGVCVSYAKKKN